MFALAKAPPVPDNVSIQIGNMQIGRSTMHTNGWDYAPDALHITFYGPRLRGHHGRRGHQRELRLRLPRPEGQLTLL